MPSGSTNSRNKMKKERPEKYKQYLDSQKKRSAEYRRKMKESMINPTEKDKEKRKTHLEKQRARMQRYLKRKKRQKAAAHNASVDVDSISLSKEANDNEPVSSTSGNVEDMQHDITFSHSQDTQKQDGETQQLDKLIPYQDSEDIDSLDEGLHIFQGDIKGKKDRNDPDGNEMSCDMFPQDLESVAPHEYQYIQSGANIRLRSGSIHQNIDTRRQILAIPDYDLEIRQQKHHVSDYRQSENLSIDDGPRDNSNQLQRESPSNISSPLTSYLALLNNFLTTPRRDPDNLCDTDVHGSETVDYINMDTGILIGSDCSPSRARITSPPEPPLNLSPQRNQVPFTSNTTIPVYSASICSSTSYQPISTTSVRRGKSVLVDTQDKDEIHPLLQERHSSDDAMPVIFTNVNYEARINEGTTSTTGNINVSSQTGTSISQVTAHDQVLDNVATPSYPAPTPYTRYRSQTTNTTPSSSSGSTPYYHMCEKHPEEKLRINCISCDQVICVECISQHQRHRLTRYQVMGPGQCIQEIVKDISAVGIMNRMMMIGHVFYFQFDSDDIIATYNTNTDQTEDIYTDGGCILDMCASPNNSSIWYCTGNREVFEYDTENKTCHLRFTCDSNITGGICVKKSGDVVLGKCRYNDDSDSDDSDSDCDNQGHWEYYLEMHTKQKSYTTCTTSVCTAGKRELKYGVIPHCIMECPVTGDLLVAGIDGKAVLLTDAKCNTKYWFRGKTVKNKLGDRKRSGYNHRLCTRENSCFDKEGNILILNHLDEDSVIVIDHETGMYIRTVHQERYIWSMCIQDNGLLWCCVGDGPKEELKSIKYIENLY